jgi:hypothetical protein
VILRPKLELKMLGAVLVLQHLYAAPDKKPAIFCPNSSLKLQKKNPAALNP